MKFKKLIIGVLVGLLLGGGFVIAATKWSDYGELTSGISDGTWNYIEIHIKSETSNVAADGIFQAWINGVLTINENGIDWGLYTDQQYGIANIKIAENGDFGAMSPCKYYDIDDIAISNTGYIGSLEEGEAYIAIPGNLTIHGTLTIH